jgi:hypothetical protein
MKHWQKVACLLTCVVSGPDAHGQHANDAHGKDALLNSLQLADLHFELAALQIYSRVGGGITEC